MKDPREEGDWTEKANEKNLNINDIKDSCQKSGKVENMEKH